MAKITNITGLTQGVEVVFDTANRTIELLEAGNMSEDGVSLFTLESFAIQEWNGDNSLAPFEYPFFIVTPDMFELRYGWNFKNIQTINLIKDGGWAVRNNSGEITEMYMNITSLGSIHSSTGDTAYYIQENNGSIVDTINPGSVNQAIKIFGDLNNGNIDRRNFFKIYLREQGKTYSYYDLISEQQITQLTYKKYTLPLSNTIDSNITVLDSQIDSNSNGIADTGIYTGMSLTTIASGQTVSIGGVNYQFNVIINANGGTINEVYSFIQWLLRQDRDIDNGTLNLKGLLSEEFLRFNGSKLRTLRNSLGGAFISNLASTEINKVEFTTNSGIIITYPFRTTIQLVFNSVLRSDPDSKFVLFFTNDDSGDNLGRDFGTANAIIIRDANNSEIRGNVSNNISLSFSYDYDGNNQRGNTSVGTVVPYTLVALGKNIAKYTITTGEIIKTDINTININSALDVFRS